jgi:hypothetical protein
MEACVDTTAIAEHVSKTWNEYAGSIHYQLYLNVLVNVVLGEGLLQHSAAVQTATGTATQMFG